MHCTVVGVLPGEGPRWTASARENGGEQPVAGAWQFHRARDDAEDVRFKCSKHGSPAYFAIVAVRHGPAHLRRASARRFPLVVTNLLPGSLACDELQLQMRKMP